MADPVTPDREDRPMSDIEAPRVCIHRSLRRQCETCDLADQLEQAEAALAAETTRADNAEHRLSDSVLLGMEIKAENANLRAEVARLRKNIISATQGFEDRRDM